MKAKTATLCLVVCIGAPACSGDGSGPGAVEGPAAPAEGVSSVQETLATKTTECGLPPGLGGLPGYSVRVWAKGTSAYTNPDPIERDGNDIWVAYQNSTSKTGGDNKTSTIVEYTRHGQVEHTYAVPGHCDGLRVDPATHLVWASSNEDGNPGLVSIDPATGVITPYTLDATLHGGGYDDVAFLNGTMFIAASNPNLDSLGNNNFPAVDKVTFNGTHATVTTVLMGNATATDVTTNMSVTLNEVDPDSLAIDSAGRLVLVNQGGSEFVFIANPGTAQQTVSRLVTATQLEDPVWIPSADGELLLVDATANTIYAVRTQFVPGTVFTETPNDSSISSLLGTIDVTTGVLSPTVLGFGKATGLLFVPKK
jgi:hypothetical protein